MKNDIVAILLSGVTLVAVASPLDARQEPDQPPPADGLRPDSATLVFEREVFEYPEFDRRNPFRPLSSMSETGPNFDQLRLMGVIFALDPEMSVALLGVGQESSRGADGQPSYRVREGQVIGNARVVEIRQRTVVFDVEEFGVRDRRTLEVLKPTDIAREEAGVPREEAEEAPEEEEVPPEEEVSPGGTPIPDRGDSR